MSGGSWGCCVPSRTTIFALNQPSPICPSSSTALAPTACRCAGSSRADPRPAPVGVQLAAYRIVQEGLTNTARHAPGATVEVALRWEPQALDIEITDDGRDTPLYPDGTGHGLVGVRERVELYGGSFHAGKATGGGFRLSARLPTP